jgi:hypothetical protein
MSTDTAPIILWMLRDPASGRSAQCALFELDGIFYVRLLHSDGTEANPEVFDGRVAAIHHAARLATHFREQGWIDG